MDGRTPILFGTVVLLLQITHGTVVFKNLHIKFYLNCGGREDVGLLAYYRNIWVRTRDHLF